MTSPATTTATESSRSDDRLLRRFVGVPFRTDTYAKLLYVLLAFPLGVAYFTLVVAGLSVGISTSLLLIGLPILVFTFLGVTFLGAVEARLASGLIGIETELPEALREDNPNGIRCAENGFVETLFDLFTAPTTWTSLVLVFLKFIYGIIAFVAFVSVLAVTVSFLSAPLVYEHPDVTYTIGIYTIETLPEALGVAAVGAFIGFVSIHLFNGLATAGGLMTAALLNLDRSSEIAE